ncbi:MAG: Metallo-beta-lactamase family protein [Candidatus Kaiserbacteria bacterium GW2011_GWC2_52_8b]|uniref:Metallo-beta-lactamase family protein n=2 Tax=Candidatus Kaiseribacteriota TaxID=1752734 RepID=A0A0G1XGH1_9BACT|nr:MAG: Metallo-beta-lactamase family protein [Candidatus Kaiserbacteria bacterium GW2011_GWA2_52_12]KKW30358.1 MAG: Metallo-beta-lactamase family protein [Candidatus Kaiserbacteria bacterium GW2011_GWC2_52_8b]
MRRSRFLLTLTILVLFFLTATIWYVAWREDRRGLLTVSFLDIGQGDSIFIDAPSGRQVLIDGGPNAGVLRKLAEVSPWWDRSIDVVIPTHPDGDHVGGLIDVLQRYTVDTIIESSVQGTTATWNAVEKAVHAEGARVVIAHRGQIVDLGDGAYLEVLSPDRDVPNVDTNLGCVVTRLVYGETSFMLPCDAPQVIENYLVVLDGGGLHSNVLKAGHHGSKTSSSPFFVGFVDPQFAVFSRGCDNKYGHPNQETIDTFARFNIKALDTCTEGTITFVSDGKTVTKR